MSFILAHSDDKVEELPPRREHDRLGRRRQAAFPSTFVTHSHEETFYFDPAGLQRRTDYHVFGTEVADCSWPQQEFGGIVIPTSLTLEFDGTVIAKPPLLDVEIFDAAFQSCALRFVTRFCRLSRET